MSANPRPMFSEMPWNIKQDIIDSTDFRTRCVLRKCSKTLRCQVNNSNFLILPKIIYMLKEDTVRLTINGMEVYYRLEADGCSVNGKLISGENYIERSVTDFAAVARHPRTVVDDVLVSDWESLGNYRNLMAATDKMAFMRAFEKEFAPFPLRIQHFHFCLKLSQQDQMRMLALIRPEDVKSLGLRAIDNEQDTAEIIASEHWNRARKVKLFGFRRIPAQSLMHFPDFFVDGMNFTVEDFKAFVEKILEQSDSFIEWRFKRATFEDDVYDFLFSNYFDAIKRTSFYKKIPGTMYHLEVEVRVVLCRVTINIKFSKVLSALHPALNR